MAPTYAVPCTSSEQMKEQGAASHVSETRQTKAAANGFEQVLNSASMILKNEKRMLALNQDFDGIIKS